MPATLTSPLPAVGAIRTRVDVLGQSDHSEHAPRVAVQLTLNLSFPEILGLLLFTLYDLTEEELDDDAAVLETLRFELASASATTLVDQARHAMDIYTGRCAHESADYTAKLGRAVTRIFGVTVPEPCGARTGRHLWKKLPAGHLPADGIRS